MTKRVFGACIEIFLLTVSLCAQNAAPSEEVVAANKRLNDLLRKPTFITLRLLSIPRDRSREQPSDTPPPYTVGELINFELFVSQSLSETILTWNRKDPYYEYHPELYRDGDIVAYRKEVQERVERILETLYDTRGQSVRLAPGREYFWASVNPDDWYEPLGPGHYQLTVRTRFAWDGEWVQSNPVTFDVVQRKAPTPIPGTVTVKLVPSAFQEQPEQKLYHLGGNVEITVRVVNNSDQRLKIEVIDFYYGNRFQLFKDGKLIPYREEIAKLIEAKEKDQRLVDVSYDLFLDPHTVSGLQNINLKDWYGPLAPGLYRLIDRRRFEIDGPWTVDSTPLLFEVVAQNASFHLAGMQFMPWLSGTI